VDNPDFIGPAVVVNEPGSASFKDYDMRVRIGTTDNDGLGVLVRVQDDNNFYRINFANEGLGTGGVARAPRGLSVQKVQNGVWTELFRDNQDTPLFLRLKMVFRRSICRSKQSATRCGFKSPTTWVT
jgi:hypothetical protein